MKFAILMGSSAMIYIPSFIKIASGILKLIVGTTQPAEFGTDDLLNRNHFLPVSPGI
jgi:hypothetical protein